MLSRIAVSLLLVAVCLAAVAQQPATPPRNLVTFFNKCRTGQPVTVAYIGGSITAQEGWRPFTTKWLGQQFKGLEIKEVNAAIGGTGSQLGVFRLPKHVLQYEPDLVFIEFAVNDNKVPDDSVRATMEGMVRRCWRREKKPDLVFVYTTAHDLAIPTNRHQAVADTYGIPTVDFQAAVKALCDTGLVDWDVLAGDRVHPNDWGHSIYAATLATFLRKQMALTAAVPPPDKLPAAAFSDLYETARLVPVADKPPAGWEALKPEGHFLDGSLLARNVGDTFECHFKGRVVGLYYEIRKDAGIVSCSVDGQPGREVDTSWGPTYKFNRESYTLLADNLTDAEHTLKITVLDKKNDLSNGHEFRLGYLMVAG